MKKVVSLIGILLISCSGLIFGQSALDQLNSVNNNGFQGEGGSGSTYNVPTVSSPQCVNCPSTTTSSSSSSSYSSGLTTNQAAQLFIFQSLLNAAFSSNSEAEAKAKAEAEAKAKAEAEAKAKAEAEAKAKYDKLMQQYQSLPGSTGTDLKPMSLSSDTYTNFFGTGNGDANIVDLTEASENPAVQSLKVENNYNVKLASEVPPMPDGIREIKSEVNNVDQTIEEIRGVVVEVASLLPPGLNYATIAAVVAVAADVTVVHDCFFLNPPNCPSSTQVAGKIAENILVDVGSAAAGDLAGKYFGKISKGYEYANKFNETSVKEVLKSSGDDILKYKNWNLSQTWNTMLKKQSSRDDLVLSIGGSVSGKGVDLYNEVYDQKKPFNAWEW